MNNIITIDGPSGSGKGSMAMRLAQDMGWHYLDSGALYRLVALLAMEQAVAPSDVVGLVSLLETMVVTFDNGGVTLSQGASQRDVDALIRGEDVASVASQVAAVPEVREAMLQWQRDYAVDPGLIADGRDMGTVVFPLAPCKIFLTASAQRRAERRYKQLRDRGLDVSMRCLFSEIQARDERDMKRASSPLVAAADAEMIDSSDLTPDEVYQRIVEKVKKVGL